MSSRPLNQIKCTSFSLNFHQFLIIEPHGVGCVMTFPEVAWRYPAGDMPRTRAGPRGVDPGQLRRIAKWEQSPSYPKK
ncbi:hypothetical protein RSOLAG1IB_02607 [Rhizoctonia solani AG-1 IB]|uniref:Uncharacterized protein n=1 Tax=Thanatephorus cucumeris (strain AG1-IB / isolate 7/3/14) TaxID=1108050 RepID=A0A0B7FNR2_THACB|nr:hypothetical protein RSOLAG1IB_02607 [Rhizoctonia solani AG-1 IB]